MTHDDTVAVLGAGAGAFCWAARAAGRCRRVVMAARAAGALDQVAAAGSLEHVANDRTASVRVDVAASPAEAVARAGTVVLCVPADRLAAYTETILPRLTAEHVLLLAPGNTGGGLFVAARCGFAPDFALVELNTLPFVARKTGPAAVREFVNLRHVFWATLGSDGDARSREAVAALVPGAIEVPSILQTSLTNFNPVVHPPVMVLNAGRIETLGAFPWYVEGSTASSGRLMDAIDAERMSVQEAYGLPRVSFAEFFDLAGYSPGAPTDGSIAGMLASSRANRSILGPDSLEHRFLDEDVPFGLVPLAAVAEHAGVEVPTISAVIALAEVITDRPYRRSGFGAAALGLSERPPAALRGAW